MAPCLLRLSVADRALHPASCAPHVSCCTAKPRRARNSGRACPRSAAGMDMLGKKKSATDRNEVSDVSIPAIGLASTCAQRAASACFALLCAHAAAFKRSEPRSSGHSVSAARCFARSTPGNLVILVGLEACTHRARCTSSEWQCHQAPCSGGWYYLATESRGGRRASRRFWVGRATCPAQSADWVA